MARSAGDENVRERWRDQDRLFEVIDLPLEIVLLNPRSHRIRAQLESHPEVDTVQADPFGESGQRIIEDLLQGARGYAELKRDLIGVGQRDPGFVTVSGLLVNGNRRAVALRDLEQQYIRVAVLPADASEQEIDELELRLQVKPDLKEEYSFTNELLFVDDLISKYSHSTAVVAQLLGTESEDVEQRVRLLALVREVQQLSAGRIDTIYFDDKEQALAEIDRKYEEVRESDPNEALRVRNIRLTGILLGLGYRELREVNEDFLEGYLLPFMEEQEGDPLAQRLRELARIGSDGTDPPGLEGLASHETETLDPGALLRLLAESTGESQVELPSSGGARVTIARADLIERLQEGMQTATQDSREDRLQIDRVRAPLDALGQAQRQLKRAIDKFDRVAQESGFDLGKFSYLLRKAEVLVQKLKERVQAQGKG
jgi:hypothetical protein